MSKILTRPEDHDRRTEPTRWSEEVASDTSQEFPRVERRQYTRRRDSISATQIAQLSLFAAGEVPLLADPELSRQAGERLQPQSNIAKTGGYLLVTTILAAGIAYASVIIAHLILFGDEPAPYVELAFFAAGTVAVLHLISRPDKQRAQAPLLEESLEGAREMGIAVLAMLLFAFFFRPYNVAEYSFSRLTVLLSFAIGTLGLSFARSTAHSALCLARRRGNNLSSIVVVGDTSSARTFIDTVHDNPGTGYRVVAHIDERDAYTDLATALELVAQDVYFDEVVVASRALSRAEVAALVGRESLRNVRVHVLPELFGLLPARLELETVVGFPLLSLFERPVEGPRFILKRVGDVAVSSLLLLVLSPLLAVVALTIRLTSPGPILFHQDRVGQRGKRFGMLKFRSMYAGAPEIEHEDRVRELLSYGVAATLNGPASFKPKDDARVTPIGRFVRRYSIDELPQLLNVLRGEMSLVGPRPALAYELDLYEDGHHCRFDVPPGLTGLWQVSGRSHLSPVDMLRLDAQYAETWSLLTDLKILLRTVPAVLRDEAG
jgi:exopolysaccharide biosynthesis polyprenyl glycosylphosphotransferase